MAISSVHYIELYINKQLIELGSQDSLRIRINDNLFDISKVSTTQATWSYSFDIPATPNNNRVLGYGNVPSKTNKFSSRYSAQVIADGELLYDGSLTVNKYKDGYYTVNLVNIKINSLEEIFGDAVMTDIDNWYEDFNGASTINSVNINIGSKYYFPFVSYGVFQKKPYELDGIEEYTSKHTIDKYNRFWIESFYPSLNVLETMRKAYEWKGYKVGGTAFADPNISNIFASCNLAKEQVPIYNVGNPRIGELNLSLAWNNRDGKNLNYNSFSSTSFRDKIGGWQQDLKFPYEKLRPAVNASNRDAEPVYNFSTIDIWNMLDSKNTASTVTVLNPTYMYDPGEQLIVIPADGWYRVRMSMAYSYDNFLSGFNAKLYTTTFRDGDAMERRDTVITVNVDECPFEVQLVRNYDDNIELIKGRKNIRYETGAHNTPTYDFGGKTYTNEVRWDCEFPHQALYGNTNPTEMNGLQRRSGNDPYGASLNDEASKPRTGTSVNGGHNYGGMRGGGTTSSSPNQGLSASRVLGYMTKESTSAVVPYDQSVSEAFICGFTSLSGGKASVMKNGVSWAANSAVRNRVFAEVEGLDMVTVDSGYQQSTPTDWNKNTYKDGRHNSSATVGLSLWNYIDCCVYLNKNDILELMAIQRDYDGQKYSVSCNLTLSITAMSDKTEEQLRSEPTWGANSTTQFPYKLNLFNFTNNETKVSEWISNVQKAFNLEILEDGMNIEINTNQGVNKRVDYAIDIDDRVNNEEIEYSSINYPREMSVKYKIDTSEYGFELTVPEDKINLDDWYEYGDSGYTVIRLSEDSYETSQQNIQTNFSYTYYDTFLWKEVGSKWTETSQEVNITIPVIEKSEFMADGYGYEDAMKSDGYSLAQRFWYRQSRSYNFVVLASDPYEVVYLSYPTNSFGGFNLSYKDSEKSILTEYFNIHPLLSSNYVTVDVYLNPYEYKAIKGGALVRVNKDLHYVSEIKGYDPSGKNTTELKLIKKTD